MIIGINGKLGSGKDTVGKIIQYLVLEKKFYTGLPFNNQKSSNSGWYIKKFACGVKYIASFLTGVSIEMWEDQEFKKQQMPEQWWYKYVYDAGWDKQWTRVPIDYPTNSSVVDKIIKPTYRDFLQSLGTDAMRERLHPNVWVNALFSEYKPDDSINRGYRGNAYPNWVITDMRFPNEMEAVKNRNGFTIRVLRPVNALSQENNAGILHSSETALDNATFDYEVINDGTIEELVEKVRVILVKERIL